MQAPELQIRQQSNVAIVNFTNTPLFDLSAVESFGVELTELQERSPALIVDLAGTPLLCSAAIGLLLSLHRAAKEKGTRLILTSLSPQLDRTFSAARLTKVFEVFATVEEAVATLQAAAQPPQMPS